MGCLMQEAFSGHLLSRIEDLRNTEPIPKPILQVGNTSVPHTSSELVSSWLLWASKHSGHCKCRPSLQGADELPD